MCVWCVVDLYQVPVPGGGVTVLLDSLYNHTYILEYLALYWSWNAKCNRRNEAPGRRAEFGYQVRK